jgi:hypothetical protein
MRPTEKSMELFTIIQQLHPGSYALQDGGSLRMMTGKFLKNFWE